jgi:hypothetical protein
MSDDVEEAMARASAQQRFGATPTASDEEEEKDERGTHFFITFLYSYSNNYNV